MLYVGYVFSSSLFATPPPSNQCQTLQLTDPTYRFIISNLFVSQFLKSSVCEKSVGKDALNWTERQNDSVDRGRG